MSSDAPCPYVRGTPEGTRWCALAADDKLREAARLALAALEAWKHDFPPDWVQAHSWPIHWTNSGSVTVDLVPPKLRSGARSARLMSVERVGLGNAHNAAIAALREALGGNQ